ncbi:MAG TPA: hypothetical protein VK395_20075 [Gemmataceae bacterium]|nr:hypothetical protein [Gemmataceae bacterium]
MPEPEAKSRKPRYVPADIVMRHQACIREIEAIRRYTDSVTSAFERERRNYEEYLHHRMRGASRHEAESLNDDWCESEHYLGLHFPAFALQTTFVATYSLLEDEMVNLARVLGRKIGIKLDPDDLKHTGIHAAKMYLESLCGIEFPEVTHAWQQAIHYGRLRNVCAHARGRVKDGDTKVRTFIETKNKLLTIDHYDQLHLSREFCFEVLDNIEALLNDLFKLARNKLMDHQYGGGPEE